MHYFYKTSIAATDYGFSLGFLVRRAVRPFPTVLVIQVFAFLAQLDHFRRQYW
jgi:hypothetical protein